MRFSHKLAKLADPRGWRSAKQHLGRVFLMRRFVFRFDAARVIASIDRAKFQIIHDRHAVENPGETWPKYLDLKRWMETNVRRVRAVELDYGRRKDVLDIGSGAGYFLYICKWLGHRPLGLDIDEVPMYPEMTRMLGLERIVWRIEAFVPLPDLGRKFDLITAFMICFNNHNREGHWGVREWEFFLDDVARHLKPGGRIWLELNRQLDGSFMTPELRAFFENRGAHINRHQVMFPAASLAAHVMAFS
jgi:SAM-dependent methyltransferase